MRFNSLQTENPCNRQGCKIPLSSHSVGEIDDETLQSELEKRGYNVTDQREIETTAEIVKIR